MSGRRFFLLSILALGLSFGLGLALFTSKTPSKGSFKEISPAPSVDLSQLNLVGQNPTLADKWVILTFGYTQCPDICPMSLAKMAQLSQSWDPSEVAFLFVTIAPEWDREHLKDYVSAFSKDIYGAYASSAQLQKLAASLKTTYSYDSIKPEKSYHSPHFFLITPDRRWVAYLRHDEFEPKNTPKELAKWIEPFHWF